jgi:hypothetical protein
MDTLPSVELVAHALTDLLHVRILDELTVGRQDTAWSPDILELPTATKAVGCFTDLWPYATRLCLKSSVKLRDWSSINSLSMAHLGASIPRRAFCFSGVALRNFHAALSSPSQWFIHAPALLLTRPNLCCLMSVFTGL